MIGGFLIPGWTRRVIARIIESRTPLNDSVRTRWLRRPQIDAGTEVCLFVTFAPGGIVQEHSLYHARAWADAGFCVVLLLITDTYEVEVDLAELAFSKGVLVRENRGYDFGAWASALEQLPEVREASLVALVNDSVYGPLNTFVHMLDRARVMEADVIAAVGSLEFGRHLQSFLLFFKPAALTSKVFWRFWRGVRASGRIVAVYRYELGLMKMLERGGLKCASLFSCDTHKNPSLSRWRELIEAGLPYLKVALLRDECFKADAGWRALLEGRGYDPELVVRHTSTNTFIRRYRVPTIRSFRAYLRPSG